MKRVCLAVVVALAAAPALRADPPHASYIFPAGGQRGTTVDVKVGGHFLHERAAFEMLGPGVTAPGELVRGETVWFEGPLIRQPASQRSEDYPQDYAGQIAIAADSPPGERWWRCWNAQGVTAALPFAIGDLPEVVELEIDGDPIPVPVTLPVTINGRVFPREDVDIWTFEAQAGQSITCSVIAKQLGSPLTAKLEVRDPSGKSVAESTGTALDEARLRFATPVSGRYAVHITDAEAGGLQHYVYRLTVTAGPWIDHVYPLGGKRGSQVRLETIGQAIPDSAVSLQIPDDAPRIIQPRIEVAAQAVTLPKFEISDQPEHLEAEPNESAGQAAQIAVPAIINGRIQKAGDVDVWWVELAAGKPVQFDARTSQLGSPLALVLTVRDPAGKQLFQADATASKDDLSATFTPAADGVHLIEIVERFARRGGPEFAYRVHVGFPQPDFQLFVPDSLSVDVGGQKNVEVQIERRGEMKSPITLHLDDLPAGVTCEDVVCQPQTGKATLTLKAAADAPVISSHVRLIGKADVNGQTVERVSKIAGQKDGFSRGIEIPSRLTTTLPTPFKYVGQYSFQFAPRGAVLRKRFTIDRGGFTGPIEVCLADRQGRHLQGVTGPVLTIPPEASEFEYPLALPPWMELGRTTRSNLMLTGEVQDAAGKSYQVCYSTNEQNQQMIGLVTAAPLRLALERNSYSVAPGGELAIPVAIKRDPSITSPIQLELVVPRHMQDISAQPVTAAAGAEQETVTLRLGEHPGPLNMPLLIRATGERNGDPVIAEAEIELVPAR
ncbi:MAG TPA: PPC domain-containing protein [Pirellulaceae bacterium]|nr:PPC domain-containing protein [Pirellulaceae bacterium]